MEVGFGFCSAHLGGVDCVTMLTTLIILTDWRSANQQSLARLGAVPSPWTRSTPWVRMASRAGGRVVSRAWSRARQRDRRWNCRVHWLQLRAVVPICNKQWLLLSFGILLVRKICKVCFADTRKWFHRRQLLRRQHQSRSRIWELKSSGFFRALQFSQCWWLATMWFDGSVGFAQSESHSLQNPTNQNWKPVAIRIMSDQETPQKCESDSVGSILESLTWDILEFLCWFAAGRLVLVWVQNSTAESCPNIGVLLSWIPFDLWTY